MSSAQRPWAPPIAKTKVIQRRSLARLKDERDPLYAQAQIHIKSANNSDEASTVQTLIPNQKAFGAMTMPHSARVGVDVKHHRYDILIESGLLAQAGRCLHRF